MWEAAKNRSSVDFLRVVSEDAVMVCGGFRCSGKEYSEVVAMFDCKTYAMEHYEIVNQDENSVQVHYVIHLEVCKEKNSDHMIFILFSNEKNHGIGTRSVLAFVNKTNSEIHYLAEEKRFRVRMII